MLRCGRCKEEREDICFGIDKNRKRGRNPICKSCIKKYRDDHKEERSEKEKSRYVALSSGLIIIQALICTRCLETKNPSDFHIDRRSATGRYAQCKTCLKTHRDENRDEVRARDRASALRNRGSRKIRHAKYRMDHPDEISASQKAYNKAHPEVGRAARQRRIALKKKATVEKFHDVEIFERDNWICSICHKKVYKKYKWPHPMSVELEHIVPLSKGGDHSRVNTACSHRICNQRKHNGKVPQQMNLIG